MCQSETLWKEGEKLCTYEWKSGGNFQTRRDNGKFEIKGKSPLALKCSVGHIKPFLYFNR
jgi:hypothetical protein